VKADVRAALFSDNDGGGTPSCVPAQTSDAQSQFALMQPAGNGDGTEEDLVGSFSAMKVSKRSADYSTIEGSPVNDIRYKRQDIHPTPYKAEDALTSQQWATTSLQQFSVPGVTEKAQVLANVDSCNGKEKLLVICSASEEHNTGDHQENALRTALLCGKDGCLRRPELSDRIRWIDSDNLTGAPLTDLLRYCNKIIL
jgi:hypothetical protein